MGIDTRPTLYGIANCDTVRKARAWLDSHGVDHVFQDYKKAGVPADRLHDWVARLGWEAVLNRNGTTFRRLPEDQRTGLDADKATALMLANPSAIKRPILERGDALVAGFAADRYAALFEG